MRQRGAEELILTNKSGDDVLEGLISNVYVIYDDLTLWTAPSGILPGISRAIVLESCISLTIPVKFSAPRVSDARKGRWLALFVSSK